MLSFFWFLRFSTFNFPGLVRDRTQIGQKFSFESYEWKKGYWNQRNWTAFSIFSQSLPFPRYWPLERIKISGTNHFQARSLTLMVALRGDKLLPRRVSSFHCERARASTNRKLKKERPGGIRTHSTDFTRPYQKLTRPLVLTHLSHFAWV